MGWLAPGWLEEDELAAALGMAPACDNQMAPMMQIDEQYHQTIRKLVSCHATPKKVLQQKMHIEKNKN